MSAGGIIYRRRDHGVEFFFIKHGEGDEGRWTLPKGHQELGEALIETAIREIREETGLSGLRYVAPIGKTAYRFYQDGKLIEKTVHFFLFEAPADAEAKLTGEEAIWASIWVPMEETLQTCGYRNLDRLLKKSIKLVRNENWKASFRHRPGANHG
ncbi:MAG TPA: NUDIX domain-containing protein [Patescibacteria group bacterium]|nr:NUDIX domain-containing protein [Patescibacteria group bacterium]